MYKISFVTFGCKVNQYETECMKSLFREAGFVIAEKVISADAVVINSCTVTASGDSRTMTALRKLRKALPDAVIALTGCYPQANREEAEKIEEADIIVGTKERGAIVKLVSGCLRERSRIVRLSDYTNDDVFEPLRCTEFDNNTRAFVKIQDGCNQFCSYCMIPYARGRCRSKSMDLLYDEVMEGEKVSGTLSKHEYADLGLSVKWATCNIGAEKSEYDGEHFAWGELTAKDKCAWENYSHTSFVDSTTLTFKKYSPEDYDRRLSLSDDVARQKWGSPWRIPTREQAEELIMFTCRKATIRGSQHGYLLTGPSGNSIFLPMSGQVTEEGLNWVGNYGYYWTSDLHDDNKYYETADVLFLSSDEFVLGYKYRYKGYSIRPVAE